MATGGKKACGAIALLVVVPAVFAQSARQDASGVRFDVSGYAVEGRVLRRAALSLTVRILDIRETAISLRSLESRRWNG